MLPELLEQRVHGLVVAVLHVEIDLRGVLQHPVLHPGEEELRNQNQEGGEKAPLIEAAAQGQADDGRRPEARRRGQTLHPLAAGDDDGARADEADARHHLGSQAGHVGVLAQDQVEVLAGQGGHGRAEAD